VRAYEGAALFERHRHEAGAARVGEARDAFDGKRPLQVGRRDLEEGADELLKAQGLLEDGARAFGRTQQSAGAGLEDELEAALLEQMDDGRVESRQVQLPRATTRTM